jgi:hypothetical protein
MPGTKEVENDNINFNYAFLAPLKDKVPAESLFPSALQQGKKEILRVTKEIKGDFLQVFYLVVTLDMRPQWVEGVTAIDTMGQSNNMVGVAHRCIFEKGSQVFLTSHVRATDTCIEYEETTDDGQRTMHYEFQQIHPGATLVTSSIYINKNFLKEMMFGLFMKKHITSLLTKSLDKLDALYQAQTGDTHPHHHEHELHEHV